MRLSDIIVYLSIDDILLSYLLTGVPGIKEEEWPKFLFSNSGGTRVVQCLGPITSEEFNFLKSNRVYGVMSYNNSFYKLLECRFNGFYNHYTEPPCIAVVSKIKPRKYDWYTEFSIVINGYLKRVPSIEIGFVRGSLWSLGLRRQ